MKIIKTIALAGLIAISMTSCCNNKADAVLENIFERRSVRKFTSEPVSDTQIEKLLRAAMAAPSASLAHQCLRAMDDATSATLSSSGTNVATSGA